MEENSQSEDETPKSRQTRRVPSEKNKSPVRRGGRESPLSGKPDRSSGQHWVGSKVGGPTVYVNVPHMVLSCGAVSCRAWSGLVIVVFLWW
jgi:hypothetical protein